MDISRICIIGAGPVGVTFAKFLLAEKAFSKIDIFEQRDNVGGIWNLSTPVKSKQIPIPQVNPRYGQRNFQHKINGELNGYVNGHVNGNHSQPDDSLEFESPLYDYLETNIPKSLMAYSDKPFPADSPLFPGHEEVLRYLEEYAEEVKDLITFRSQVLDVRPDNHTGSNTWSVAIRDLRSENTWTSEYDAVVVANGHYTVPSVPDIAGIQRWSESYPGSIIHSKAYRKPEAYDGQKVLVIGNSASGLDIALQVSSRCQQPVLLSARSVSAFGTMPQASWRRDVDEVVEFLDPTSHDRAVRFRSGMTEEKIDSVIFCTGYFYAFPFLSDLKPPVVSDGLRTQDTYQHFINIDHPSLAVPVINLKVIPFPLAENQAAVVARMWSGRLSVPPKDKMRQWETEHIKRNGAGKNFHLMRFPGDALQINELYEWARSAATRSGLENGGQGKLGTGWNERQVWLRSQFAAIKGAYNARGRGRFHVRTIEELGFDFDKWRASAEGSDLDVFRQARCK